jgi:inhibitor of cysteine peptidase
MDPELKNNEKKPLFIREQDDSSRNMWYTLIVILFLLLIGWYGYTSGWFGAMTSSELGNTTSTLSEEDFGERVVNNPAPIDSVEIQTLDGFPVQQVVVIKGTLPNGCTYVNEPVQLRDGNVFYITLDTYVEGDICTEALVSYEKQIALNTGNLPAGVYIVNVNGRELSFEFESDNVLDFTAGEDK